MTVPELDFHSTDSLVSHSKLFPAEIHVPHHQLRNFISTAYEDKIFFVHNYDIFVLDTQKQQRSLVATVPFEARCLAANHGWVCVGGESKGDCAFLEIGHGDSDFGQYGQNLVVDMLGKEIVNSMTIHQIPGQDVEQSAETVILISNNDKSVTLYSLSQQEVLCVLPHPVPMNYASMSPDCTMIAAVGDSNEVYFYQRKNIENQDGQHRSRVTYQGYNWRPFAIPQIPAGEGVLDDFSFAVAFSSSGQFCAVSAQGGAISIFDMQQLVTARNNSEAEAAILCTFRSSRASLWGCVRSISFSPEPWDLLAWTEDHGTIGVADVRRSFVRRQCVSLNREATEVAEIENITLGEYGDMDVKERLKHQYMQRIHALRGHPPVGARSLNETHDQQAVPSSQNQEDLDLDLDARERSVIEALETTIGDVEHDATHPYSVNYTSSPTVRPSASSIEQRRRYDVQLLNPGAQIPQMYAPRRRQSVILSDPVADRHLSPPATNRALITASPSQLSEDNPTPPMSTNDLTPSNNATSQPMPYNIPPSDPWHVIEAQLNTSRLVRPAGNSTAWNPQDQPPSLAQIEAAIYAERQMSNRLENLLAAERQLSANLMSELETRRSLLDARQHELQTEQTGESPPSPSIERTMQRQFRDEQEHVRQRSNDIEHEIVSNSQRIERLMAAREALVNRTMDAQSNAAFSSSISDTSASVDHSRENSELDAVLRHMEEERRTRRQHIQNLEVQIRRAESRVEIASVHSSPNTSRDRVADARFLAATTRPGYTAASLRRAQQMDQYGVPFGSRATPSTPSGHMSRLRATAAARRSESTANETGSTIPRTSELSGRATENDMRLARFMFNAAAVMDANGNWVAGHTFRRAQNQAMRSSGAGSLPARTVAVEDMLRESGVGTAGIGWSPDGSNLYIGSEIGIFELQVNLRDRMQFPSLEMR